MPATQVDARGLSCPLPVMHAKEAVVAGAASLEVLVDSGTAKHNVASMLDDAGYEVTVAPRADGWTITARRD